MFDFAYPSTFNGVPDTDFPGSGPISSLIDERLPIEWQENATFEPSLFNQNIFDTAGLTGLAQQEQSVVRGPNLEFCNPSASQGGLLDNDVFSHDDLEPDIQTAKSSGPRKRKRKRTPHERHEVKKLRNPLCAKC